eukprot:NODE_27_length_39007_cov_1.590650.p9 type:complete len:472 gc:universal NODE_27_length_39007_cov_1.590650:4635-6050(+)
MNRVGLNQNKAGLDRVDKEKADEIIYNASKHSKFFKNEEIQQKKNEKKLEEWRVAIKHMSPEVTSPVKLESEEFLWRNFHLKPDRSKVIAHFDLDYFYAQVEEKDDNSLRNFPMAVGGIGMLSTTNYQARKYGIRAGMPGFIAKQLYPELKIVPLHFDKYKRDSILFKKALGEFSETIQSGGLDEAYVDLTDLVKTHDIESVVSQIRNRIFELTGLTCSAGVGPNKLVAKIASDEKKPNGQFVVDHSELPAFISKLPIKRIFGVGKVTSNLLSGIGISCCADLIKNSNILRQLLSTKQFEHLLISACGESSNVLKTEWERKSISAERSFVNCSNSSELYVILRKVCRELARRLLSESSSGLTLTLKIKLSTFEVKSRSTMLNRKISYEEEIYTCAQSLLSAKLPLSLRLIGVRLSNLCKPRKSSFSFINNFEIEPNNQSLTETKVCPICLEELSGLSISINKHIDVCLATK